MTDIKKEDIEECISKGMSNSEIFEYLKISKSTLRRLCVSFGLSLDRRASPEILNSLTKEKFEYFLEKGYTLDRAAEEVGVARSYLAKKASELDISFRRNKFIKEEYLALKEKGMLDKDIAKYFGMTPHGLHGSKVTQGLPILDRNFDVIKKEEIEDLYVNKKVPISEISKILDKGVSEIYALLKKYNLNLRRDDGTTIKKEELDELIKNKVSFSEIAKIFRTTEDSVKKAMIRNDLDTEELLSSDGVVLNRFTPLQIQLLYGGMLGDSSIELGDYNQRLKFDHGLKQKDYIQYKLEILKNFIAKRGLELNLRFDKRTNKTNISVSFRTIKSRIFTDMYPLFYNPEKYVNTDVLNSLNEVGLCFWFMDDGYKYGNSSLVLCTECFNNNDLNKIVLYFKERWDITCDIDIKERRIYFCNEEGFKFQDLISPSLFPYFQYKLLTDRKRPYSEKKETLLPRI